MVGKVVIWRQAHLFCWGWQPGEWFPLEVAFHWRGLGGEEHRSSATIEFEYFIFVSSLLIQWGLALISRYKINVVETYTCWMLGGILSDVEHVLIWQTGLRWLNLFALQDGSFRSTTATVLTWQGILLWPVWWQVSDDGSGRSCWNGRSWQERIAAFHTDNTRSRIKATHSSASRSTRTWISSSSSPGFPSGTPSSCTPAWSATYHSAAACHPRISTGGTFRHTCWAHSSATKT